MAVVPVEKLAVHFHDTYGQSLSNILLSLQVFEWGRLLVALNEEKCKRDWSDAVFVQLCLMARDMDMNVRVSAFDALGKMQMVSEDLLMQSLSKKALESTKKKNPGHAIKLLNCSEYQHLQLHLLLFMDCRMNFMQFLLS